MAIKIQQDIVKFQVTATSNSLVQVPVVLCIICFEYKLTNSGSYEYLLSDNVQCFSEFALVEFCTICVHKTVSKLSF